MPSLLGYEQMQLLPVRGLGAASLRAFGLLHSSGPALTPHCAGCCSCERCPSLNSLPPCFIFLRVLLQTSFAERMRQKKTLCSA